ncbi:GMC family oxidoreductase [Gracilibacillus sp. YIM 98692]|uniref:GMC oxidoreductase n=1 Tax=Gracilibacillus sp. YIM 98692 TaxID=2663532 RepID=UPI0013D017EE|nr:GMC family oxidoreductase [Gracilibacillus sp. YIM 98692]
MSMGIPFCPTDFPDDYMEEWIPTVPLSEMEEKEYDVLIIGSGAGGGSLLWRLCQKWKNTDKKIGMLEAGDALLPTHVSNIPTMNIDRLRKYLSNPKISEKIGEQLPQYKGAMILKILGGATVFWGAVCPRMPYSELKTWPIPLYEMDTYYNIADEAMNITPDYFQDSPFTTVLLDRLRSNGFPLSVPMPMAMNLEPTQYGIIQSNVIFSSIEFLGKALQMHSFDLAINARATRLCYEGDSITGVEVMSLEKKLYKIKAKKVVVSAGALETPRLLLHSNIPGPAIGHYLSNHSISIVSSTINRNTFPALLGALGILIPSGPNRDYQIQIESSKWDQPKESPLEKKLDIGLSAFGKVESRFENKVTLDPNRVDEYGVPKIQVQFSYSKQDDKIIHEMSKALLYASSAMGSNLVVKDGFLDLCLRQPGRPFHDLGTCRMGVDSYTSAVNPYCKIHGISGLYVADNSIIPTAGAVNPTLTTVALSIRTADHIASSR